MGAGVAAIGCVIDGLGFVATDGLLFEQPSVPIVKVAIKVAAMKEPTMAATLAPPCSGFNPGFLGVGLLTGTGFGAVLLFELLPCKLSCVKFDIVASDAGSCQTVRYVQGAGQRQVIGFKYI